MMKLLIIDDEENMCHMLKVITERHGYHVTTACNGREGLDLAGRETFDFILCDIKMPVMDGMAFLEEGKELLRETTVIMMSAYGSIDTALEAMKTGAYDFISKPFKSDEVLLTLKKAEEREVLRKENKRLRMEIEAIASDAPLAGMIGESDEMLRVFSLCRKVAKYDTTVLITGESGTGKELIARGIHKESLRRNKGFMGLNCGSIPHNLLESELFGHVRGAFTGADVTRKGILEEVDGGTVFLDEIGDLPLEMQVKLLRVLQEREIRPVGASQNKKIDVRILAATSRDLPSMVENGVFREDLFYRLNVVSVHLPSLKQRKDDIPGLCRFFIQKLNKLHGLGLQGISSAALKKLNDYSWPGNIRELENIIQYGAVITESDQIQLADLEERLAGMSQPNEPAVFSDSLNDNCSLKKAQKRLEKKYIRDALKKTEGNKSKAAILLEMSYPSLLNKIKEYEI